MAVLSELHDASCSADPTPEKATQLTTLLCPLSTATHDHLDRAAQMQAVASALAVASKAPSWLNARPRTGPA